MDRNDTPRRHLAPGPPWRWALWGGAALILLLPLAAMQVTSEMNWGAGDFASLGALLAGACIAFELVLRATRRRAARAAAALAIIAALILIWAELAVGIFGA